MEPATQPRVGRPREQEEPVKARTVYLSDRAWEALERRAAFEIASAGKSRASSVTKVLQDLVNTALGLDTVTDDRNGGR